MRARRLFLRQLFDDVFTGAATLAAGVTESAATHAVLDIENEVVARAGRNAHGHGVKSKGMPSFPGHDVVGARGISADAKTADNLSLFIVKGEAASEYDDAADRLTNERVVLLSKFLRIAGECGVGIGTTDDAV